jgi:ankyrin repeat protein
MNRRPVIARGSSSADSSAWWRAVPVCSGGFTAWCCVILLAACSDPQADALKQLAAKGYNLSVEEFFKAARADDAAALRLYVAAGMSPNVKDAQGRFALGEAVKQGRLAAVDALIATGATVTADQANATLEHAVRSHQVAVLHALLDAGVRPSEGAKTSPLVVAAQERQREMADLLFSCSSGQAEAALIAAAETGDVAVLSCLLKHGALPSAREEETDRTPLLIAAAHGQTSAVEMLLASGADRTAVDGAGHSALDLALEAKQEAAASLLRAGLTEDEARRPLSLNGAAVALGASVQIAPEAQWVLLGCHEETLPWQLESLQDAGASLLVPVTGRVLKIRLEEPVPGTSWILKALIPSGMFSRPCALLRDRDSWKHLLLVQSLPVRRGLLCAWLQSTADRSVYEARPGDRFSAAGKNRVPVVVKEISPMQVTLMNEADPMQLWILKPGGVR